MDNQPQVTSSQTGGSGTPIQVENVQYNVQVGKVRSKMGLIAFLFALFAWVITLMVMTVLLAIRSKITGDAGMDFGHTMVFALAVLIPAIPIFWYVVRRLNLALTNDPLAIEDLFFKRTIRLNLIITIIVGFGWIIAAIFNILSKIFLSDTTIKGGAVVDSIIFALVFSALALLFLKYQKMTKR